MLRGMKVIGFGDMVGNYRKGKRMKNGGICNFLKMSEMDELSLFCSAGIRFLVKM